MHQFSIKKGANYYGLIFGSNHTLGMEKFLKVCWDKDEYSGESNFNLDNDFEPDTLFYDSKNSNKQKEVRQKIYNKILHREISDNISGLKYAMKNGCLPKLFMFIEVVKDLEKEKKIRRIGGNYASVNIHKVKAYSIEVL